MVQPRIREAHAADIPEIQRLQNQWAEEDITYGYVPPEEDGLRTAVGPYFLVAKVGGHLVGHICGSMRVSQGLAVIPEGETYLEIDDLYVDRSLRSQGVGGLLLEELLATARKGGIRKVHIFTGTKDVRRILKFYESHGFRGWGVQMYQDL